MTKTGAIDNIALLKCPSCGTSLIFLRAEPISNTEALLPR